MFLYSKTTQSQIINESYSSSHMCRCTSIIGNSLVRKSIAEIYGLSPIWNGQLSQDRVCWWLIYLQKEETKKDWSLFSIREKIKKNSRTNPVITDPSSLLLYHLEFLIFLPHHSYVLWVWWDEMIHHNYDDFDVDDGNDVFWGLDPRKMIMIMVM